MIIWHRNRRGRGGTTPRCRSRNVANNTFSEGRFQKSNEFAGLRTAPATHHAKNTANTTFSCGMLQNAGFGTIPCGGGGGSEPRTGIIYRNFCVSLCVCEVALERALAENQAKSYFVQHPQKLCPEISWQTGVSRVSGSLYSVLCPQGLCHWLQYLGTDWMETIFASVWTGPRSPAVFWQFPS